MKKYSRDKLINQFIHRLLKSGNWSIRKGGKKHYVLIAPNNKRIGIPSTPSDCRAFLSFSNSVKYLLKEQ